MCCASCVMCAFSRSLFVRVSNHFVNFEYLKFKSSMNSEKRMKKNNNTGKRSRKKMLLVLMKLFAIIERHTYVVCVCASFYLDRSQAFASSFHIWEKIVGNNFVICSACRIFMETHNMLRIRYLNFNSTFPKWVKWSFASAAKLWAHQFPMVEIIIISNLNQFAKDKTVDTPWFYSEIYTEITTEFFQSTIANSVMCCFTTTLSTHSTMNVTFESDCNIKALVSEIN